ncbi:sensor domain-containing diguanylate cyclase [Leucothrix sargassi]|nr:sensor domain-containing diguanylate cyclase [Leucothrix sargassi]
MSHDTKHSIERIGRSIYPLRVFGFILLGISALLSLNKLDQPLDAWSFIGISLCLIYPHLALLHYLKYEKRETEIRNMQADMLLIGFMAPVMGFNPTIILPYLIANSSANYALRGTKLVIQGLALALVAALLVATFREQTLVFETQPIELVGPFVYLSIVTHYMGYLAYVRGISLIKGKKEAQRAASRDFLTGLDNRRSMFDKVRSNDDQPIPHECETTLIMADVDHFKSINDQHGHDHGDAVLIQVSGLLKDSLRGSDLVARWGGEEFLILLPNTKVTQGLSVAENIREAIAKEPILFNDVEHRVTLTLGVASYGSQSDFEHALKHADKALYKGKESGRNQVVAYKA